MNLLKRLLGLSTAPAVAPPYRDDMSLSVYRNIADRLRRKVEKHQATCEAFRPLDLQKSSEELARAEAYLDAMNIVLDEFDKRDVGRIAGPLE